MVRLRMTDEDGLAKKLKMMNKIRFNVICRNNLVAIFNRTATMTPVDTRELLLSRTIDMSGAGTSFEGVTGYVKDYAPHVEFGHRTVDGGYVQGQQFLQKNVAVQQKKFFREVQEAVKNA